MVPKIKAANPRNPATKFKTIAQGPTRTLLRAVQFIVFADIWNWRWKHLWNQAIRRFKKAVTLDLEVCSPPDSGTWEMETRNAKAAKIYTGTVDTVQINGNMPCSQDQANTPLTPMS